MSNAAFYKYALCMTYFYKNMYINMFPVSQNVRENESRTRCTCKYQTITILSHNGIRDCVLYRMRYCIFLHIFIGNRSKRLAVQLFDAREVFEDIANKQADAMQVSILLYTYSFIRRTYSIS